MQQVLGAVSETGCDPARLCLEMTEGSVMRDIDTAWGMLRDAKEAGYFRACAGRDSSSPDSSPRMPRLSGTLGACGTATQPANSRPIARSVSNFFISLSSVIRRQLVGERAAHPPGGVVLDADPRRPDDVADRDSPANRPA